MKTMRATVLALALLAACKTTGPDDDAGLQSNGIATGELRGFANITVQVRERLFDKAAAAAGQLDVELTAGQGIGDVKFLLGSFSPGGDRRSYVNGQPNPLNVLLWHQILARLADKLGAKCDDDLQTDRRVKFKMAKAPQEAGAPGFDGGAGITGSGGEIDPPMHASFAEQLLQLCNDAKGKTADAANLDKVWRRVMTSEAVRNQAAWKGFAAGMLKGEGEPKRKIANVLLAMFMDPEFLLEK